MSYKPNERITIKGEYTLQKYLNKQPGGLTDKQFLNNPEQSNRNRNWFKVNWNLYNLNADFKLTEQTRLNVLLFGVFAGRDALGTLERTDRFDDTTKNRTLLNDVYNNFAAEIRLLHRYAFLKQQSNFLFGVRAYKGNTSRKQGEADKSSNPNFNFYIKEVVRLAGVDEMIKITHKRGNKIIEETKPKYNWIMSHTCRRSFCTNEFLDGTPTNLIMAISGHKTEKAFRRYIKADQVQKAYMIKKLWDNRPGL